MVTSRSPTVTLDSRIRYRGSVTEFGHRPLEAGRVRARATRRTNAGMAVPDGSVVGALEGGNALDNGGPCSGDGTLRISVVAEKDDTKWMVVVRDRGIGIDPDDTDRIFQVFDRRHSREGSTFPVAVSPVPELETEPETTLATDADAVSATDE